MGEVGGTSRGYLMFLFVLSGILLFLAFRGVNWPDMMELMRKARPEYLGVGCLISSVTLVLRGLRWRILLGAEKPMAPFTVFWAMTVGYLGNFFLPARAGELIRSVIVGKRCGVSTGFVLATAFTEKVIDAIVLVLIGLVAVMSLGGLPGWLITGIEVMGIVAVVCVVGLVVTPRLEAWLRPALIIVPLSVALRTRMGTFLGQFLLGMRAFQHFGRAVSFAGVTVVIWLADALGMMILGRALDVPSLNLLQALFILAALGLASAVPSAPGNIGIYQFVAVTVLPLLGFSRTEALTYIIVLQASIYAVVTLWGLLGSWRLGKGDQADYLGPS